MDNILRLPILDEYEDYGDFMDIPKLTFVSTTTPAPIRPECKPFYL